ncbi:hypothetical protein [Actinomadura miaoliensis]|uniref:DUF1707 domain-containing protein n=1 Tax=Actinomadura miaoliensis TaxID=430685 RepID=A0ABP7WQ88_9ACTN
MTTSRPPRGAPAAAGPPHAAGLPHVGLPGAGLPRDDLAAALAARRELGPDYDAAFAETVVDRVEQALDARLGPRPAGYAAGRAARPADGPGIALVVVSLLAAIPLSAIGVVNAGLPGLLIVWAAIVLINLAHALRPRP